MTIFDCLGLLQAPKQAKDANTSPPGGNQVDGLPPAASTEPPRQARRLRTFWQKNDQKSISDDILTIRFGISDF